jgi:hypothetical protein
MQIGVPAEYCTTQNASDIFQSWLYLEEPIGKFSNNFKFSKLKKNQLKKKKLCQFLCMAQVGSQKNK